MVMDYSNNRHNSGLVSRHLLLRSLIKDVPDFPKEGILFKDITPLLGHADAFAVAVEEMADPVDMHGKPDALVCVDARGFFFGAAIAIIKHVGVIPIRKLGKLPGEVATVCSTNEYATADLCVQIASIKEGMRVWIIDDVLATGGTIRTVRDLLEMHNVTVLGAIVLIELMDLKGREAAGIPVYSVIQY
jgi:adenine phosphoribosyltransferase